MDDLSKLEGFGARGDADLVSSSLLAALPEHTRALGLLHDVSRELTAILDLEELLRRIAQRVKPLVDYHAFTVTLWNESSQLLEPVFALRYEDTIPLRGRLALHQGLTGAAAAERRIVRVGDVREDPRFIRCEHGVEVRSELAVPLLLQDRLVGILDLESAKTHAFTAEDERMLQPLGSYIAVALENARLFGQVRENERRLQHDLDTAREIQLRLLPVGAPKFLGSISAQAMPPRSSLAVISTIFFPPGRAAWRLPSAMSPAKARLRRSSLHSPLAFSASTASSIAALPRKCSPVSISAFTPGVSKAVSSPWLSRSTTRTFALSPLPMPACPGRW